MVRDDKGPPMLDAERNGSGTLSSGDAGEADDDSANIGGITTNIGDFTTNLDELGKNSTNPPCILTSGQDVKVGLKKPLRVPLDEEEQNIRETKRASKKLSSLSAKRKLELDETTEKKPPHKILDDDVKSIVKLNTASRPSGRPKQKKSFKKAKRSKEITDTLAYVDTVATVGDVTLKVLDEVVKTQQLAIAVVGDALDGIRRIFDGAVFKRPKALVIKGNHSRSVESNIRFGFQIREELFNDTKLASSDIVISILGVGTFSLVDIERMLTWHEVSKKLTKARKLVKFVEKIVIDDDHKEVERQRILHMIPFMSVDSVFSANGHNISLLDLAGGDQWLSDSCVFLASLRVVKEAEPQTWQNPKYVTVVDPLYLQLSDVE
ncbi:hypothetical protein GN958_ATG03188 [Phytophthora infestans]|uniref:Uncharacterized protein n=1 Tax=Phytophthora infestans TaxID=4787 RepID=A0A8S9V353_PHYIN|nr:hypothetical protein GN958_ATG03188 [Phytophthora infestans]